MPPAEREQATLGLAQGVGKREYAYSKCYKVVVLVNDKAEQSFVGKRKVHLHELLYLLWGER